MLRSVVRVLPVVALVLLGGCTPALRPGTARLTPLTPLGTVVVRVAPASGPASGGVTLDGGAALAGSELDGVRATMARLVADARVSRAVAERMVRIARERTTERLVLAADGAVAGDTVLEVSIADVGLVRVERPDAPPPPSKDPLLTLVLTGTLRIQRVPDGVELLARPIRHEAGTKPLSVWAKDDLRELRGALPPAVEALAGALVDEVF
jgi:hypothetical protein